MYDQCPFTLKLAPEAVPLSPPTSYPPHLNLLVDLQFTVLETLADSGNNATVVFKVIATLDGEPVIAILKMVFVSCFCYASVLFLSTT
jgi:hypothetical protein